MIILVYFCRIFGAILIMIGLYAVLWGKSKEKGLEDREKEETLTKHLLGDETCSRGKDTSPPSSDIP